MVSPAAQSTEEWFCNTVAGTVGPVPAEHIIAILQNGQLSGQSLVWRQGFPAWVALRDVPDLSCHLPLAQVSGVQRLMGNTHAHYGANRTSTGTRAWQALAIAAALGLLFIGAIAFLMLLRRPPQPGSSIDAVALTDIGQAIGVVVSGFLVTDLKTGELGEKLCRRATCFAVSSGGHLLTARPLIDEYLNLTRADAKLREARDQGFKVEPKLWVFLDKEWFPATVELLSEKDDVAVLKVARQGPTFGSLLTNAISAVVEFTRWDIPKLPPYRLPSKPPFRSRSRRCAKTLHGFWAKAKLRSASIKEPRSTYPRKQAANILSTAH